MGDEDVVTGRLERDGTVIAASVTATVESDREISFLFPPDQLASGDKAKLLVPPDRVIELEIVHMNLALGQAHAAVAGRIISDVRYPAE